MYSRVRKCVSRVESSVSVLLYLVHLLSIHPPNTRQRSRWVSVIHHPPLLVPIKLSGVHIVHQQGHLRIQFGQYYVHYLIPPHAHYLQKSKSSMKAWNLGHSKKFRCKLLCTRAPLNMKKLLLPSDILLHVLDLSIAVRRRVFYAAPWLLCSSALAVH